MRSFKRRARQGFTVVELMISLTVGGIAISSLYAVGAASTRHFKEQQRISTTQSSLRSAMNQLKRDFARAGYLATPNVAANGESCGTPLGAPINNPSTVRGAGRLAAISGYQRNVAKPPALDPDNLNTRLAVVDDVILMGNYATSGEYMGIVLGPNNLSATVPTTSQSFTRDFTNWYAAGGAAAGDCSNAALANAFPVGRLVRVRTLANTNGFAQVTQATCNTDPTTATITFSPQVSGCNATGGWISPVNTLRYRVVDSVFSEASRIGPNRVAVLRRSEVNPADKDALLMNGTTAVDDRAVLDYVVRFTVDFITRTAAGPNRTSTVPATQAEVQLNPEFVRGAIIELVARTAEHEPDMDVSLNTARLPPFRVLTTQGAARTRSLRSEDLHPQRRVREVLIMAQAPRKSRFKKRSEEGAVMLVVMLILLTATALAGISLQATQYELRAAGFDRTAMQTQYVSETAMATTMSWIDTISLDGSLKLHVAVWNDPAKLPVDVTLFGEPTLTNLNRQDASRTQWSQQARLTTVTIPPITMTGANNDPVGTFGPRSSYHPGTEDPNVTNPALSDYVVDMYDCRRLMGAGRAGTQVNQSGSGAIRVFQLYCVVTARGRSFMFGTFTGKTKTWQTATGVNYQVNRFAMAHDSRGTIVSPPIVQ